MNTSSLPSGWSLLYVADPLCSWCYGFAPSVDAVRARWPALPFHLLMGGLRPEGEPLDERLRATLQHHWAEVERRSGQPFVPDALELEGFVYTTEPACRAVVTVRELGAGDPSRISDRALAMQHAIQDAFYARGLDATDPGVLAEAAEAIGIDRRAFEAAFDSAAMREATQRDFLTTQQLGIRGFPALAAVRDGQGQLVAQGWMAPDELIERLEQVLAA